MLQAIKVTTYHDKEFWLTLPDGSLIHLDLTPYEAWNTGRVDFTGWPLRRVMDVIARWYGMTVIYDSDDYSQIEITGSFNKYDTLGPTLEALSTITDLTIRQQGNTINISAP